MKQDELMYEEFKRMNDILQNNTESLKLHMKRTALLEEALLKMDKRITPLEMEKIKQQAVNSWLKTKLIMLAKIGGAITAIVGAYIALLPYIQKLF